MTGPDLVARDPRRNSPPDADSRRGWRRIFEGSKGAGIIAAAVLLLVAFPFVVPQPQFWVVSIAIRSLWLGVVALSLIWLARNTGMLSLGQMTFFAVAGYTVGVLTTQNDVPYVVSIPAGILLATAVGAVVALIAVRTQGVYFLMLTLAVSQLLYFLVLNAATLTRGYQGISNITRPEPFGLSLDNRNVFYFLALAIAAGAFALCWYVSRTPFGLALRGIRDSPERMRALGYNVYLYRMLAFTFAAFIAAVSGALAFFYHGGITPGAIDLLRSIDVLIVSVLGGINSLWGAFAGALGLTMLQNFAQAGWIPMRRVTLTGVVFVVVLLFFRGGIVDLPRQLREYGRTGRRAWNGWRGRDLGGDRPASGRDGDGTRPERVAVGSKLSPPGRSGPQIDDGTRSTRTGER
ncbi:branched-chain amino acid ABC transporter permease [Actinobacteria bacterium YIM 96077]|uniref:Branched-chain amino acid ABC transporter permease n=1 Tax=Phytoactinopolyspora halophila TaxID=1981511 RepID=A0A329QTJ3_9ACTN|nr:branched-chain amino acid ABC transporter permease [Phytoactinopolyspora halophila]AYY13874.1 branched-chain amino acid ABC transporter permease [Actinobacteria bacterium YIM 96077]RAW15583.1 branched-chain amino acid ABC transporter permease [Phytoactinopolyspora halophila]